MNRSPSRPNTAPHTSTRTAAKATRTAKALNAKAPSVPPQAATTWLQEASTAWSRQQAAAVNTLEQSWLDGAETLRRLQLDTTHHARERHEQACYRIEHAEGANEVLTAQADTMNTDLQAAGQYWQRLAVTASEAQMSWLAHANDALFAWLSQWPGWVTPQTTPPETSSALAWWAKTWQSMLPPPVFPPHHSPAQAPPGVVH